MNIDTRKWGSYDAGNNSEENNDGDYDVIEATPHAPGKSPPFVELKRSQSHGNFSRNFMRDSMVGFRDGIPGIFSGYKGSKIRSSIKKKQPFYGDNDNYSQITDVSIPSQTNTQEESIYDEVARDSDFVSVNFPMPFNSRSSITNQRVIVETGLGNNHVETGMRFYDPKTETPHRSTSSFLIPLSTEEDISDSSWDSDIEQSIVQSIEAIPSDDAEIYEAIGSPRSSLNEKIEPEYANVDYDNVKKNIEKLPRLPPRNSIIYISEDDKETYFEVELKEELRPVKLPPLKNDATEYQIKRYQLIKCIMEKEYAYMTSLRKLVKDYEEPLIERDIIKQDRVKVIFKDVHEIMQCHQLFNMALSYRANEWEKKEVIGDVIHASFSKSMVFKAYCNFVCSFSLTMDSIKETCKLVPAFLSFLKNKEYDRKAKQSLYYLMCKPLEYIPNLVLLTEALLKETPFPHEDRLPLQMALTQLECLCATLGNERMNIMMKEKVKKLDAQVFGLEKELACSTRYFIRHDDMLLCETENGKLVKTKPHRIFMLNDLILCASYLNKRQQMQLMTNKLYKVKWCCPINNVHIVDVTSGIYINTDVKKGSGEKSYQVFSGHHPSEYMDDLLHDLTMVGDIMGKVSSLRLSYSFVDSNKVNEWYKEIHKKLDSVMEMANMNWIEMSLPSNNAKGEREEWLFNVPSPRKKIEWSMDFENINLLLTGDNNPGWYMQEENTYEHEFVNLRRALPLVASIQPLFMINPETSVQCVLNTTATSSSKPILWIFSGNEQLGVITLLEMNMSSVPHVLHSYVACNERICCAEIVMKKEDESKTEVNAFVWIGTISGRILIYNALDVNERQPMMSASLDDSVVSMKSTKDMVFVGLANGNLLRFTVSAGATWDISNPTIVSLSLFPIMSIVESCERLWCASGSAIYIINIETMIMEEKIATCEDRKGTIKQLITYGIGVWVAMRKSSILLLFHGETKGQLQMINTTTPITRMKNEIEGPIRDICIENIYVTTLLAKEGLLWVGVDQGLIVTYPLPKLGGIPIVSGKACVSFHAHGDTVKHIHAFSLRRFFQCEDADVQGDEEIENPAVESVANVIKSMDPSNEATKRKADEIYSDPEYFVLELESEPVTETSSVSVTDDDGDDEEEKEGEVDSIICDENQEQKEDKEGVHESAKKNEELIISEEIESKIQIPSENNGKEVEINENEVRTITNENNSTNTETVVNNEEDEYDSDDDISPTQDFCFIEDEMSNFPIKDFRGSPLQTLSVKLGGDNQPSVDNLSEKMPFLRSDGFAAMMENFDGFNKLAPKSNSHTNLNSNKDVDIGLSCPIEQSNIPSTRDIIKEDNLIVDLPVAFSNVGEEGSVVPVEAEIPVTFSKPSDLTKSQNSKNVSPEVTMSGEVTENKDIEEERSKNDIPYRVEIPLTYPTKRRTKRQSGVRSVNIPICDPGNNLGNTTVSFLENKKVIPSSFFVQGESFSAYDVRCRTENDTSVSSNNEKSMTACDSTDAVGNSSLDHHIYEVPLKICNDMYAALENNSYSYQDSTSTENINSSGDMTRLFRSKSSEEYRNKSLPRPDAPKHVDPSQKSAKRTSLASTSSASFNNCVCIPPLRRKQKGSRKASTLTLTGEENKKDCVNNSWYVVSIGSGHVDLRKETKYSENLNLLNSSSFEGREPMLLLWKLNAGNSFYS